MIVHTYADQVEALDDKMSIFEYFTFAWGNLVTCKSKKQKVVVGLM